MDSTAAQRFTGPVDHRRGGDAVAPCEGKVKCDQIDFGVCPPQAAE